MNFQVRLRHTETGLLGTLVGAQRDYEWTWLVVKQDNGIRVTDHLENYTLEDVHIVGAFDEL